MPQSYSYGMMKRFAFLLVGLLVLQSVPALSQIIYNPNDERFKQLALEKTIWTYKERKFEYERAADLLSKSLISEAEFDMHEREYQHARIEVKQAMLALTQESPYLLIDKASTHNSPDGVAYLTLSVRNAARLTLTPGIDSLLLSISEEFASDGLLELRNVFVSVQDSGVLIGYPYEIQIDRLIPGENTILSFRLLKPVNTVTVVSNHLGRVDRRTIYVTPETGTAEVLLAVRPQSQECFFGETVRFAIELSRSHTASVAYLPVVDGLPAGVTYQLRETNTNAAVPQLHIAAGIATIRLGLLISLPDRATADVPADSSIAIQLRLHSDSKSSPAGEAEIELIPRGRGSLDVRAGNWLSDGEVGETIHHRVQLINSGSQSLRNVRWVVRGLPGWYVDLSPEDIDSLMPGKTEDVALSIRPSPDATAGSYEIEITAESFQAGRVIRSDSKILRVNLTSGMTNFMLILILCLVALVLTLIGLGLYRLGRR